MHVRAGGSVRACASRRESDSARSARAPARTLACAIARARAHPGPHLAGPFPAQRQRTYQHQPSTVRPTMASTAIKSVAVASLTGPLPNIRIPRRLKPRRPNSKTAVLRTAMGWRRVVRLRWCRLRHPHNSHPQPRHRKRRHNQAPPILAPIPVHGDDPAVSVRAPHCGLARVGSARTL